MPDAIPAGMPAMTRVGSLEAPTAPQTVAQTGLSRAGVTDLLLRLAFSVPDFTTAFAADQTRLPFLLVNELLGDLRDQQQLDVLGEAGSLGYRYAISDRGRERARRALEISGHAGPAPVPLAAYNAMMEWQAGRFPKVEAAPVEAALAGLVLPPGAAEAAGLAVYSGRSLFLFGPAGNGKTTVARLLHAALTGDLWVPHCVEVDGQVIRVFDPHWHQPVAVTGPPGALDFRWVRVRRPFISIGGEATAQSFELTWSPALRVYESPLHFKANGGMFLIDDFGRQRVAPDDMLNRWITPLEYRVDHLTLHTGQTIRVPFLPFLVLATNLDPDRVMDPAFLRRMGYRVYLGAPTPADFAAIADRYARDHGLELARPLVDRLLARYQAEGRPVRACEPRDLIERARDFCPYRGRPEELTEETLERAWSGYFGVAPAEGV
jgi:hypothetical protein